MQSAKQKEVKARELVVEPKKAYYDKAEPMRLKLRKARLIDIDDGLKRLYRIKN